MSTTSDIVNFESNSNYEDKFLREKYQAPKPEIVAFENVVEISDPVWTKKTD